MYFEKGRNFMDAYFYVIDKAHHRTMERIAVVTGVVFAENEKEAEDKAWERNGGITSSLTSISKIPEEGFNYYIPLYRRRSEDI